MDRSGHVLIVDVIGPATEVLGYILVPVLWALGALSNDYLFAFLALTFGCPLSDPAPGSTFGRKPPVVKHT
jgi:hypothetical protein